MKTDDKFWQEWERAMAVANGLLFEKPAPGCISIDQFAAKLKRTPGQARKRMRFMIEMDLAEKAGIFSIPCGKLRLPKKVMHYKLKK